MLIVHIIGYSMCQTYFVPFGHKETIVFDTTYFTELIRNVYTHTHSSPSGFD